MAGANALDCEIAEVSAAREGIRHLEQWEKVDVEDLHYGELMYQTEQIEKLHKKLKGEQRKSEGLQKELSLAARQ